ncbi:MAG: response regulator [Bdellovibrionales bacterium]|nr:response regulator [Bdellovibrionales bacterium]
MDANLKGKTVLVVDDEPDLRELMVSEFEFFEANVLEAQNGEEAFEIVKNEKVDVVVSDILMPGGSGLDLLDKLKSQLGTFPPVFFITGFAEISAEDAIKRGAKNVFSKPFNWDEMIAEVAKSIN